MKNFILGKLVPCDTNLFSDLLWYKAVNGLKLEGQGQEVKKTDTLSKGASQGYTFSTGHFVQYEKVPVYFHLQTFTSLGGKMLLSWNPISF